MDSRQCPGEVDSVASASVKRYFFSCLLKSAVDIFKMSSAAYLITSAPCWREDKSLRSKKDESVLYISTPSFLRDVSQHDDLSLFDNTSLL